MKRFGTWLGVGACLWMAMAPGCGGDADDSGLADVDDSQPDDPSTTTDEWTALLAMRTVDYSAALRIAALRLTGQLPTLAEIKFVADAVDQKAAYEALIAQYLQDPRFAGQMLDFWRDTFKMGGSPLLDSAPAFAAQLVVENRPMTELFTATVGTCPSFDPATGSFAAGDCGNGVPAHAGVLSNPGVQAHFFSNMAFRRVRWVQETFACGAFPAEVSESTEVGGGAAYTSPWPLESIAGTANGGTVDFLDTSSVVCANCHSSMNHLAPLFGTFDESGAWTADIAVSNPTEGSPRTAPTDWLPAGEATAWRLGVPALDLPSLGAAMAADPAVHECLIARVWNWALGKADIVDSLAVVPSEVIAQHVSAFESNNYQLRDALLAIFTSDDFVRF